MILKSHIRTSRKHIEENEHHFFVDRYETMLKHLSMAFISRILFSSKIELGEKHIKANLLNMRETQNS